MAAGILGTAVSGLMAFQRSLDTTSHNIANVNTDGYSRQRVELGTKPEQLIGSGYVGNGVKIENITRSYDQFITKQLRSSFSAYGDADRYSQLSAQVDNLLADPTTSMSAAINGFFNGMNDVADDPSSVPARQALLAEAEILIQRFGVMNGRLEGFRSQVNQDLDVTVDKVNTISGSIAELNAKIAAEFGRPSGAQMPNDLLDKRDLLINQLSELVDVSVVPGKSNMVSIFIGKGQSLVMDANNSELTTQSSTLDPFHLEIGLKGRGGAVQLITREITGGELTGTLRFRDDVLNPAQHKLGAIAASVAMEFNKIHQNNAFGLGNNAYDLDGNPGQNFFSGIGTIPVTANPANTGSVTVAFDPVNISNIDAGDYQLDVSAGPAYTLTKLSDETSVSLTDPGTGVLQATAPDILPGITITLGAPVPVSGDTFLIRPSYSAAGDIMINITDPRDIAAATNIDSDGVTVINGPMPGDNRNALLMAELENKLGMQGGKATFKGVYGQMVSEVGSRTHAASVSVSAQETLLNNAKESRSEVSGVNLDEEAANLVKFQQSYQAAAQLVAVTNSLFDSLLNGIR